MRRILIIVSLIAVLLTIAPAYAAQFMGGYGLIHANSALVLPAGALDLSSYGRSYVAPPNQDIEGNVTNITSAFSTSFGYSNYLEIGISQVLFQSLNLTSTYEDRVKVEDVASMSPGDTYIRFKFGNHKFNPNFYWAIMPNVHYRVAKFHDVQLEPYSGNSVEFELMFILSWFQNARYVDEGMQAHLNLSFTNHNDVKPVTQSAQSLNFVYSFLKHRDDKFDYGVEMYGQFFAVAPLEEYLSRENWVYVTPMARYDWIAGMQFYVGMDLLAIGKDNTTRFRKNWDEMEKYPNYPEYRITTRLTYKPPTSFLGTNKYGDNSGVPGRRSFGGTRTTSSGGSDRESLFKWAVEERGGNIEAIDIDLAKIREDRKRAEAELERLKKELESRKKK